MRRHECRPFWWRRRRLGRSGRELRSRWAEEEGERAGNRESDDQVTSQTKHGQTNLDAWLFSLYVISPSSFNSPSCFTSASAYCCRPDPAQRQPVLLRTISMASLIDSNIPFRPSACLCSSILYFLSSSSREAAPY